MAAESKPTICIIGGGPGVADTNGPGGSLFWSLMVRGGGGGPFIPETDDLGEPSVARQVDKI